MRRKEGSLNIVASFPWPIGLVLGVVAFCVNRYGVPAYLLQFDSPVTKGIGKAFSGNKLALFAVLVMAACWVAAGVSYLRASRRRRLLDSRSGLDSLVALSWREFEILVGEAYRRQGYSVEETGLGGADGGVDLILRRGGTKELVQCKQWRARQVNAPRVREMWGLVDHFEADAVKIVCIGEFTRDAMRFAEGKRIELVSGKHLLALVRSVQSSPHEAPAVGEQAPLTHASNASATCPLCHNAMLRRHNRTTKQAFWGCSRYPACRGTRQMEGRSGE